MLYEAMDETALREAIRTHPLVTDPQAWQRPRPFRVAMIEQCTYDGTIYSAEQIVERIGHLCEYIVFDEAWAGFMKFHPIYAGRFAMGLKNLDEHSPGIIATQSTHKQLASFERAGDSKCGSDQLGHGRLRRLGQSLGSRRVGRKLRRQSHHVRDAHRRGRDDQQRHAVPASGRRIRGQLDFLTWAF